MTCKGQACRKLALFDQRSCRYSQAGQIENVPSKQDKSKLLLLNGFEVVSFYLFILDILLHLSPSQEFEEHKLVTL